MYQLRNLKESEAIALTAPFPYALVTSLDKNSLPNAMEVAWASRTSSEPFLLLISIDYRRYSHEGIQMHKEFVLNTPMRSKQMLPGSVARNRADMAIIKLAGLKLVDYIFSFVARFSLTTLSSLDMLVVIQRVAYL